MAAEALPLEPCPAKRPRRKPDTRIDEHDAAAIAASRCRFQRSPVEALHTPAACDEFLLQTLDQRGPAFTTAGAGDGDHLCALAVSILHPRGQMRPGVGHDPQQSVHERAHAIIGDRFGMDRCRDDWLCMEWLGDRRRRQ